jgi:hypothetical protein
VWRKLGLFGVIVTDVFGASAAGVGFGYLLREKAGAPWWVMILTAGAGLALGMYHLYFLSKREL